MTRLSCAIACFASVLAIAITPATTHAQLNDWGCRPSAAHPRPVVLVHGHMGNVDDPLFHPLIGALNANGYCVFGTNYGQIDGVGAFGRDHLTISGSQVEAFMEHVRSVTGAAKVDAIGHSAGAGVINNIILEKGRVDMIDHAVSFGGLHHPYAHFGAATIADGALFLPSFMVTARTLYPGLSTRDLFRTAIDLFIGAGGSPADVEVVSNFVIDLFDPDYWMMLHGGLSEADGIYATLGNGRRSLPTADSAPEVCYLNVVGFADFITGTAAGFQDEAPNVDNFVLWSGADHSQILTDPMAIDRTLGSLGASCPRPAPIVTGDAPPDGGIVDFGTGGGTGSGATGDEAPPGGALAGGCSATSAVPAHGSLLLVVSLALLLRRRRR